MIKTNTILRVSDNSGVRTVKCIKILGGYQKKYASVGDFIVVTVKEMRNISLKNTKIKKKDIFKALIIRVKNFINKKSRIKMIFKFNSVVLLDDKLDNPIGTRIFGYLPKIIKHRHLKCYSLSIKRLY